MKEMPVSTLFLVCVLLFGGCLCFGGDNSTKAADVDKKTPDIKAKHAGESIEGVDLKLAGALSSLSGKDYEAARNGALEAKQSLAKVDSNGDGGSDGEVDARQNLATLIFKTSLLLEEKDRVLEEVESAEVYLVLPKLELLRRGYVENSKDWKELSEKVKSAGSGEIFDSSQILLISQVQARFADMIGENIVRLKRQASGYEPVEGRGIPRGEVKTQSKMIPAELSDFFDRFDADGNGLLSIGEAQEFFFAVENNVVYRYDDESETMPVVGTLVGDNRPGSDYRQTPMQTYKEKAGDCEDMATLEQAFYTHFGIAAYVVAVNSQNPRDIDHAAAIVRMSDNVDDFRKTLGGLLYYELKSGEKDVYGAPVKPGVYMLVDNAYSGALGYLSGGVKEGTFQIHCKIPLDKGYESEWGETVKKCKTPMN